VHVLIERVVLDLVAQMPTHDLRGVVLVAESLLRARPRRHQFFGGLRERRMSEVMEECRESNQFAVPTDADAFRVVRKFGFKELSRAAS